MRPLLRLSFLLALALPLHATDFAPKQDTTGWNEMDDATLAETFKRPFYNTVDRGEEARDLIIDILARHGHFSAAEDIIASRTGTGSWSEDIATVRMLRDLYLQHPVPVQDFIRQQRGHPDCVRGWVWRCFTAEGNPEDVLALISACGPDDGKLRDQAAEAVFALSYPDTIAWPPPKHLKLTRPLPDLLRRIQARMLESVTAELQRLPEQDRPSAATWAVQRYSATIPTLAWALLPQDPYITLEGCGWLLLRLNQIDPAAARAALNTPFPRAADPLFRPSRNMPVPPAETVYPAATLAGLGLIPTAATGWADVPFSLLMLDPDLARLWIGGIRDHTTTSSYTPAPPPLPPVEALEKMDDSTLLQIFPGVARSWSAWVARLIELKVPPRAYLDPHLYLDPRQIVARYGQNPEVLPMDDLILTLPRLPGEDGGDGESLSPQRLEWLQILYAEPSHYKGADSRRPLNFPNQPDARAAALAGYTRSLLCIPDAPGGVDRLVSDPERPARERTLIAGVIASALAAQGCWPEDPGDIPPPASLRLAPLFPLDSLSRWFSIQAVARSYLSHDVYFPDRDLSCPAGIAAIHFQRTRPLLSWALLSHIPHVPAATWEETLACLPEKTLTADLATLIYPGEVLQALSMPSPGEGSPARPRQSKPTALPPGHAGNPPGPRLLTRIPPEHRQAIACALCTASVREELPIPALRYAACIGDPLLREIHRNQVPDPILRSLAKASPADTSRPARKH